MATKSEIRHYAATNNVDMNAARQHFIELAKKNNPKFDYSNLVSFGAFYRALDDNGFNFAVNIVNEPKPGFTKFFAKIATECGQGVLNEVRTGTWDIQGIQEQLAIAIECFNEKVYGTSQRPHNGNLSNVQVDVQAVTPELIAIFSDIYALQELGEITNNEYNGMLYGWAA